MNSLLSKTPAHFLLAALSRQGAKQTSRFLQQRFAMQTTFLGKLLGFTIYMAATIYMAPAIYMVAYRTQLPACLNDS